MIKYSLIFCIPLFLTLDPRNFTAKYKLDKYQIISKKATGLDYLKNSQGKYPNEINLLDNSNLTFRLKKLLKNRYIFLKNSWTVETPIEIKNNTFIAWGCQQHNCSNTNFIIVVDFSKNIVYVGIRENENVKTYSEDGTTNKEIIKWATRI